MPLVLHLANYIDFETRLWNKSKTLYFGSRKHNSEVIMFIFLVDKTKLECNMFYISQFLLTFRIQDLYQKFKEQICEIAFITVLSVIHTDSYR